MAKVYQIYIPNLCDKAQKPFKNHSCMVRGFEPGTADLSQSKLRISFSISGRCSNSGFSLKGSYSETPIQLKTVHFFDLSSESVTGYIAPRNELSFGKISPGVARGVKRC